MSEAKRNPSLEQLTDELKRTQHRRKYRSLLRGTVLAFSLIVLAAFCTSFFLVTVLVVQDSSMEPTLRNGDILVASQNKTVGKGDIVAFYDNDHLLVKRLIAAEGDVVVISPDGLVTINGIALEEPYLSAKALGDCDLIFPYTVPKDRYFVLGDERSVSLDSRHDEIGCIAPEQLVGRILFRIWPFRSISLLNR